MAKTREKKVVHSNISTEKMEEAFAAYAKADAMLQKINATLDIDITKLREKRAVEIQQLSEQKDAAFDVMQAFAIENKDELFAKKKSMDTTHGVLGFRLGTPKLKTRKGFTWGAVTNLIKEFLPSYIRISEEPAKDKLLADRDSEEITPMLEKVGVMVVQDETFFVEPKKEE